MDYVKIKCHGGKRSPGLDSNQRSLSYQDFNHNFWNAYKNYLEKSYRHETMKAKFSYARQYYKVLADQNASPLLRLQPTKRIHVMKAMSTLSKFLGCYNIWQDIRNRHNLKWTNTYEQDSFTSLNLNLNLNTILEWLKTTLQKIPTQYGNILMFDALTGLRPNESTQSLRLLKSDPTNYFNPNNQTLEHFKHPKIFFRKTKKAYITIVNDRILDIANQCGDYSYVAIRLYLKRRNIDMHMAYCHKIFATYLHNDGIESEIIDILQGRTPKSIFAKHYFKPDYLDYKEKVLDGLNELYKTKVSNKQFEYRTGVRLAAFVRLTFKASYLFRFFQCGFAHIFQSLILVLVFLLHYLC